MPATPKTNASTARLNSVRIVTHGLRGNSGRFAYAAQAEVAWWASTDVIATQPGVNTNNRVRHVLEGAAPMPVLP